MKRSYALCLVFFLVAPGSPARADDDPIPDPVDPGPGYEGLLPAPDLPRRYLRDQHTIPYGVQSVANTPVLHLGQSFRPRFSAIDWVAFVFQNSTQPSDPNLPGPGTLRVSLYSGINPTDGALSGLLGESDEVSIDSDTTEWLVFHFENSIGVQPGAPYYLHVEQTSGYQSWVGIRRQNIYLTGSAFGYFYDTIFNVNPPQNLQWGGHDLHFAEGIVVPAGDTDLDGDVDIHDLNHVRNNFGGPGLGDVTEDGVVGIDDLNAVRNEFGVSTPFLPVPEPSTKGLVLMASAGWLAAYVVARRHRG
jgi:hypothetical protein